MKIKQLKNGKWIIQRFSISWLGFISPDKRLGNGGQRFWWKSGDNYFRYCWLDSKAEAEKLLIEVESELGI